MVPYLGPKTNIVDFGTLVFSVLAKLMVLEKNGPQIWTRGKGLSKGRYLDYGATLGS